MVESKYIKLFMIAICLVCLTGCSQTVKVQDPFGKTWKVTAPYDALVEYDDGTVKLKADLRGLPSTWEYVFPAIIAKTPDITIESE